MTEMIRHAEAPTTDLATQMEFARAVQSAGLLPANYRGRPADIMLAVGLGQSMGLSPAESLYRIDVIQGKPTASAELIAANVRKAGHKLRVRLDEQQQSATATIVRADDPEFEHTVTRDMAWAKDMGLLGKDNYKKQPLTMLQHRAVTAVARMACPEALYGVAYTADEMGDVQTAESPRTGLAAVIAESESAADVSDAEVMLDTSSSLAKRMFALFGEIGVKEKSDRLAYVADVVGREIASSTDMTEADARAVIAAIEDDLQPADAPTPDATAEDQS